MNVIKTIPKEIEERESNSLISWLLLNAEPEKYEIKLGKKPVFYTAEMAEVPSLISTSGVFTPYFINLRDIGSVVYKKEDGEFFHAFPWICSELEYLIRENVQKIPDSFISSSEAGTQWGAAMSRSFNVGFSYLSSKIKYRLGETTKKLQSYLGELLVCYVDDLINHFTTTKEVINIARNFGAEVMIDGFTVFNRKQYDLSLEFENDITIHSIIDIDKFTYDGKMLGLLSPEMARMINEYTQNIQDYSLRIIDEYPEWILKQDETTINKIITGYEKNHMSQVANEIRTLFGKSLSNKNY